MSTNLKRSVSNSQNELYKRTLKEMMTSGGNSECVDCGVKAPRWASVNLGVFMCLQCSGIHRGMGVHISQVRSTTLDTWLPEQVEFMKSMGNAKANSYYEAKLVEINGPNWVRPDANDKQKLEKFIRDKYERKK